MKDELEVNGAIIVKWKYKSSSKGAVDKIFINTTGTGEHSI